MTTRERWIVYPLLFLAVGNAFWTRMQLEEIKGFFQRQVDELPQSIRFGTVVADEVRASRVQADVIQFAEWRRQPVRARVLIQPRPTAPSDEPDANSKSTPPQDAAPRKSSGESG